MNQHVAAQQVYLAQLQAELRRLESGTERTRRVLAEVFAHLGRRPDADLGEVFGPAEEFVRDALDGRRPLRSQYLEQLSGELIGQGLPGERVGQVLAEVDEYVTDCGEDPAEAFGPPAEYAQRIAEAAGHVPPSATRHVPRALLVAAVSTAGTLLSVEGVAALPRGGPAPLTAGVLVAVMLVGLLQVGSARVVRRPAPVGIAAAAVALVGGWLAQAAVLVRFRAPVLVDVPAVVMVTAGLGLVATGVWAARALARTALPEPFSDPRPGAGAAHPAFWDVAEREGLARGTARAAVVFAAVEIAVLAVAVLLLR